MRAQSSKDRGLPQATNSKSIDAILNGPVAKSIGDWASVVLDDYVKKAEVDTEGGCSREAKQVNDPIARVIHLTPWEVLIADSPVMQRLRYVRQLGVGHFLFPSCGYSRFEHSLGSLQMASAMLEAMILSNQTSQKGPIHPQKTFDQKKTVVRLAALLHDIGHCVFSHVSERFYARDDDLVATIKDLNDHYDNKLSASETLTILIVSSPAFRNLLRVARVEHFQYQEADLARMICECIAGSKKRVTPNAFMAEIVNGPVDCDKLDYLMRDGHMAGVPVSLDIQRLLSKLRLARVKSDDGEELFAMAVVPSGARALEELMVSRIFLYDKFYYHPKVMAAEELVRRALYHLAKAMPHFRNAATLLPYGDDEFLALTPSIIAQRYPHVDKANPDILRACDLLSRARLRVLPKRVFAFARRFLPDAPEPIARFQNRGKKDLVLHENEFKMISRFLEDPSAKEHFAGLIGGYAKELGVEEEVFIGVQSAQRAAGNPYLHVILPDETPDDKPHFLFKAGEWTEAYALNKQTHYVFSYGNQPTVHLAAERCFYTHGDGLAFGPSVWDMAKISREALTQARAAAVKKNLDWIAHRLPLTYSSTPHAKRRIASLRDQFAPTLKEFDKEVGPQLVAAWISQFPDGDLQESALRLLEQITYVGQPEQLKAVQELLEREPSLREMVWIPIRPLDGKGKSADHLLYMLKESKLDFCMISSLTADRVKTSKGIVFFDDSLNSGVQAKGYFASWFDRVDLNERGRAYDLPLSRELREAIQEKPVVLHFYSAHKGGIERLRETFSALSVNLAAIHRKIACDASEYTLEGMTADSAESKDRFVGFLQARGEALLVQRVSGKVPGWDAQRAREFALGFGSISLTVLFTHTISASTPVALWEMSSSDADYWLPLFPRQREPVKRALFLE